jgi:hypothetical protein
MMMPDRRWMGVQCVTGFLAISEPYLAPSTTLSAEPELKAHLVDEH